MGSWGLIKVPHKDRTKCDIRNLRVRLVEVGEIASNNYFQGQLLFVYICNVITVSANALTVVAIACIENGHRCYSELF